MKTKSILLLMLGIGIFILQGCSDSKPSDSGVNYADATFTGLYNNLFSQECRDCHFGSSSDPLAGDLDFTSASSAYVTLTTFNATGTNSFTDCGAVKIVDDTVQESYLMAVLFDEYNSPIGGTCTPIRDHIDVNVNVNSLAANFKTALVQWISNGAPND